jgi:hypothetical protein
MPKQDQCVLLVSVMANQSKQGPGVLFCMPNRTKRALLVSVMCPGQGASYPPQIAGAVGCSVGSVPRSFLKPIGYGWSYLARTVLVPILVPIWSFWSLLGHLGPYLAIID